MKKFIWSVSIFVIFVFSIVIINFSEGQDKLAKNRADEKNEVHKVINKPYKFAWDLFIELNHPADLSGEGGVPDLKKKFGSNGRVVWETWISSKEVFKDPLMAPKWPVKPAESRSIEELEEELLQQKIRSQKKESQADKKIPEISPKFDPVAAQSRGNEVRMNRAAFKFIVKNELYNIEGQEKLFRDGKKIDFPGPEDPDGVAMEVKAQWRKIDASEKTNFHTFQDSKNQYWGLTALHITTKHIPQWFWVTFEHKDNPGIDAVVPNVDKYTQNGKNLPEVVKGTKWENYVLRGVQTNFIDQFSGKKIIVANSQIERGFQATSSCMTCHARATIGAKPRKNLSRSGEVLNDPHDVNRLSVFKSRDPVVGFIGNPKETWFGSSSTYPKSRNYISLDFVWSLIRAKRKYPFKPETKKTTSFLERYQEANGRVIYRITKISAPKNITLPLQRAAISKLNFNNLKRIFSAMNKIDVDKFRTTSISDRESEVFIPLEELPQRIQSLYRELSEKFQSKFDMKIRNKEEKGEFPRFGRGIRLRNEDARISHRVGKLENSFPNITHGKKIIAAVFDGGKIRFTHVAFSRKSGNSSRVKIYTKTKLNSHSTHVAGTIGANPPKRKKARGMAKNVTIYSFDWEKDLDNLNKYANTINVSNHSYGPMTGWEYIREYGSWFWFGHYKYGEDQRYGKYLSDSQRLDRVLYDNPHLLTFVAAGNDRNDGKPYGGSFYIFNPNIGEWERSRNVQKFASDEGYDTIAGLGVSKNSICVGAIDDLRVFTEKLRMTSFSNWGPMDDLRIKPDLVANGFELLSTSHETNKEYKNMSGTSMAAPTASGIACKLVNLYKAENKTRPLSSEIKAILIHTARGENYQRLRYPKPNPKFGWGSIDSFEAGKIIHLKKSRVLTFKNNQNQVHKLLKNDPNSPIRITMVWTDPAGKALRRDSKPDMKKKVLVNDLDIMLESPTGKKYYPWRLSKVQNQKNEEYEALNDGKNSVDNVEVVDVSEGKVGQTRGEWKIHITGRLNKSYNEQKFALVVSGLTFKKD